MDLLNLIINPRNCKSACFLCFTQEIKTTSIYDNIEILDGYPNICASLSLMDMTTDLFPGHEVLLEQACDSCSNLIIKMYIILRKNKFKKLLLSKIVDILSKEVSRKHYYKAGRRSRKMLRLPNLKDKSFITTDVKNVDNQDIIEKTGFNSKKCLTLYSRESVRKQKRQRYNSGKSMICDTCGKLCKSSNRLRLHLNCHRTKQCPVCMKTFKSHSHFTLHVKQHEETFKRKRKKIYFSCHDCDYKSLNKATLQAHINSKHLHKRPFKCHICPKSFYKKSNLTQHKMIHDNVKKEMCHICGENYVSQKTLLIHMKLHLNEKSYECKICHKKFVTSGHRLEHFNRNHTEKSQSCVKCDKRYGLKKDLNRHFKRVHLNNAVEAQSRD